MGLSRTYTVPMMAGNFFYTMANTLDFMSNCITATGVESLPYTSSWTNAPCRPVAEGEGFKSR